MYPNLRTMHWILSVAQVPTQQKLLKKMRKGSQGERDWSKWFLQCRSCVLINKKLLDKLLPTKVIVHNLKVGEKNPCPRKLPILHHHLKKLCPVCDGNICIQGPVVTATEEWKPEWWIVIEISLSLTPLTPAPAMTSVGLCSTSDFITFDQNLAWSIVKFCWRKRSCLWYPVQGDHSVGPRI